MALSAIPINRFYMKFPPENILRLPQTTYKNYGLSFEISYGDSKLSCLVSGAYFPQESPRTPKSNKSIHERIIKTANEVRHSSVEEASLEILSVPKDNNYKLMHLFRFLNENREISFAFRSKSKQEQNISKEEIVSYANLFFDIDPMRIFKE